MRLEADSDACSGPSKMENGMKLKEKWTKSEPLNKVRARLCSASYPQLCVCVFLHHILSLHPCLSAAAFTRALQPDYGKYKYSHFGQC